MFQRIGIEYTVPTLDTMYHFSASSQCSYYTCHPFLDLIISFSNYLSEEYEQSNSNSPVECPVDCEKVSYEAQLSATLYLPQKLVPLKKHEKLRQAKNMPNDTDGMVQFML